jgi:hypothetical protein
MRRTMIALAGLPVFLLIAAQSVTFAQTAREPGVPLLGDAWALREELIYVPREAIELQGREHVRSDIATGDIWAHTAKHGTASAGTPHIADDQVQSRSTR